tara:strand:- start:17897 stop:18628 length:732 start_codon:yes stop_codon:yes gene_type:complete
MDTNPIQRVLVLDKASNGPHSCESGLYYAHHQGKAIWRNDGEVVLRLEDSPACGHIASPDVHEKDGLMFYHGGFKGGGQKTFVVKDKIPLLDPIAPFYLRAWYDFQMNRWWGVAKHRGCSLFSSADPTKEWVCRAHLGFHIRHAFVNPRSMWMYYSKIGDAPEHILRKRLSMSRKKLVGPEEQVLTPEKDWEGVNLPLVPSIKGIARSPVHQLRDPMIHETRLYYSVAGEQGIAFADFRENEL